MQEVHDLNLGLKQEVTKLMEKRKNETDSTLREIKKEMNKSNHGRMGGSQANKFQKTQRSE